MSDWFLNFYAFSSPLLFTYFAVCFNTWVTSKRYALVWAFVGFLTPIFLRSSVNTPTRAVFWWLTVLAIAVFLWVCVVRFPELPWRSPKQSAKSRGLGRKSKPKEETPNENAT